MTGDTKLFKPHLSINNTVNLPQKLTYGKVLVTMATNVEVEKNANENNLGVLRRFTKRVQGAGILPRVRSLRYEERTPTKYGKKKSALKRLSKKEAILEQIKLGKVVEKPSRR